MPAILFSRLEDEVMAFYAAKRRSTRYKVEQALGEFKWLPDRRPRGKAAKDVPPGRTIRKVSDIIPPLVNVWLELYKDRADMTNRSVLKSFSAICTYAKKRGWLKQTPFDFRRDWIDFDEDDETDADARHLSLAELDLLLAQLDADALCGGFWELRDQALGYTYAHTGLRLREALKLKVEDVRLDKRVIRIRKNSKRKLKTRTSRRIIGIADDLAVVLERWLPVTRSEWLFPGVRRKTAWDGGSKGKKPLDRIKAAGERAGLTNITVQMLRRSVATHGRRFGISRDEMKDVLGHGSVRTQEEWYLEQDADNARELASRIRIRSRPLVPSPNGRGPSAN